MGLSCFCLFGGPRCLTAGFGFFSKVYRVCFLGFLGLSLAYFGGLCFFLGAYCMIWVC